MKKVIIILLIAIGVYLVWRWWNGRTEADAADRGKKIAFNRLWVDKLPQTETDVMEVFAAITDQPVGIFQSTSMWKGNFELFTYEDKGDGKMLVTYPQTKDRERISYRAWKCDEGRFTYCLDVTGASRGVKRYVSEKDWEIGAAGQLPARLSTALSHIHQ
jgi:hypothetical protein